jgi:hypothetical protein
MSFMVLDEDDLELVWDILPKLQLIFHPKYSPDGQFKFSDIESIKRQKNMILLLDRNLLSSLLRLCEQGCLKDELEMRTIALIMAWSIMNGISISAGLAVKENASKESDSDNAKLELAKFQKIFDYYPSMTWLSLANGTIDKIEICPETTSSFNTDIQYHEDDDHFLMHLATMLHIVYLHRQTHMTPKDKFIEYIEWSSNNLLICQYSNTYAAMLFTNQDNIRPPKHCHNIDFEKMLSGCKNQAWDINYLSNWSAVYWEEDIMDEVFLFATADKMLKTIFINTHGDSDIFDLIETVFSKNQAKEIVDFYDSKLGQSRIKPDFGNKPKEYFYQLINKEKERFLR